MHARCNWLAYFWDKRTLPTQLEARFLFIHLLNLVRCAAI